MDLAGIMDALAGATPAAITTTKYAYPVSTLVPPAIVVGYPTETDYDATMGRGADRLVIPVWYFCGAVDDKASRTLVSAVISGANEMKAAIEGNATLLTKADSVRVTDATPESVTIAGVPMIAVRFDIEVYA